MSTEQPTLGFIARQLERLPIEKADMRDQRPRIGEAGERAEFAEQGGGRLRADARDGLQHAGGESSR